MNSKFFENLVPALAAERLDAYRQDQVEPHIALARYLRNMALCESLYSQCKIRAQGLAPWIEKLRHHWPAV